MTAMAPLRMPKGARALVGVVHLGPLPGAPRASGPLTETIERAVRAARAWREGGADALLVENFGDAPFFPGRVPHETVAAMTAAAIAVRREVDLPLGVNVLRNDAEAALAVAVAAGASFIRVNVLAHAYVADQGILEGAAHILLRRRRELGAAVSIFADLLVKHAEPLAPLDAEIAARDLVERASADAIVVTGRATGLAPDPERLRAAAAAVPGIPVFVGSGSTPENAGSLRQHAAGFLAATWCEKDGVVDPERVRALAAAVHGS